MYRKLKVYAGPDHPHAAQKPSTYALRASASPAGAAADRTVDKSKTEVA
jgi:hypothetical protein